MANPTGRGGFKKGKSGNPGGRPRQLVWSSAAPGVCGGIPAARFGVFGCC